MKHGSQYIAFNSMRGLLVITLLVGVTQGIRTSRRHISRDLFQGLGHTVVGLVRQVQNPQGKRSGKEDKNSQTGAEAADHGGISSYEKP